jgi:glycosyltransferase involved in cell wall biosynthesis
MDRSVTFFIYSLSGGGAERATITLATHWAAKSWRVTIITIAPIAEDFYKVHPSIQRVSLSLARESRGLIGSIWNNFRRIVALRRALRDAKSDVVIAMMTTANVLLALASIGLSHRRIGAEHIHPPQLPLGRAWELLRRTIYGYLHAVTALTQQSAEWIRRNTNARSVRVIPNPILWPIPSHNPILRADAICKPGRRIILAVGRLASQKQFEVLVMAFARIYRTRTAWDLVILGEGPERNSLQALVNTHALTGRVFLPGNVGNIGDWYERADIFVLTSRFEGFPYGLVEAMAYGLPPISYDCETGPRDILSHEKTGLLIPLGDFEGMVEALLRLMDDEDLRRALGKRAQEIRERLSVSRIAAEWERLVLGDV